jgi:aryl-alcohol dehydrogenase-like predicted oxidoreductase
MPIEKRSFGNTGHISSAVIFGAAALWECDQHSADQVLDQLLNYGVNHIDVAPAYGDAELRVGHWMRNHREDFFLATKVRARDKAGAWESLNRSLERLQTDRIDLLQLHALIHPDDWDQALGPDGALEALVEARDQDLIRFIGVTGHGWHVAAMHKRSLDRFAFDSVLMPWNWFCAHHRSYPTEFENTRAICAQRNVAVQTIKAIARGPWAAGANKNRLPWYQPLEEAQDIRTAVHWVLSEPDLFLNSVGDLDLLPHVLKAAAESIVKPDEAAMNSLQERAGLASIFGI